MKIKEKFRIKATDEGHVLVPEDPDNTSLLTKLWAGEPIDTVTPLTNLDVLISRIKTAARGLGMTVNVCGHLKKAPVVILYYAQKEEKAGD